MVKQFDLYIDTQAAGTFEDIDFSRGVYYGKIPYTINEIEVGATQITDPQTVIRELTGINMTNGRLKVINSDGSLHINGETFFNTFDLSGAYRVYTNPAQQISDFSRFNNLARYIRGMEIENFVPQAPCALYFTYSDSPYYAALLVTSSGFLWNDYLRLMNKADNSDAGSSDYGGTIIFNYGMGTGWRVPTVEGEMSVILTSSGEPYGMMALGWSSSAYTSDASVAVSCSDSNNNILLSNTALYAFLTGAPEEQTDPYAPGGTSGGGGGTGNFDLSSDAVDFPALPTLTAVDTGLVSIYTPTLTQLKQLATYMWNANPTDVDWWKKLVANPLDLILGLSIVPVAVPQGAVNNVKVGLIDTGVPMTRAATQFVEVDCGSLEIKEFWGSALDYSPFRKHSIYLPFIGTRTINTDDIMNKTISVKYHVDLLSGALTAMVKCGDAVLYQYSGACAVSLPLTGETFTSMITSTIQLAASLAGTIASGGAAAGITAAAAANSVMSMKPQIERAGGVSGAAGQLGVMTPYLIGEIPRQSVPENSNTFMGYPSNIKAKIGDLAGFTSVDIIHLENITATNAEKEELESILKDGVLL